MYIQFAFRSSIVKNLSTDKSTTAIGLVFVFLLWVLVTVYAYQPQPRKIEIYEPEFHSNTWLPRGDSIGPIFGKDGQILTNDSDDLKWRKLQNEKASDCSHP